MGNTIYIDIQLTDDNEQQNIPLFCSIVDKNASSNAPAAMNESLNVCFSSSDLRFHGGMLLPEHMVNQEASIMLWGGADFDLLLYVMPNGSFGYFSPDCQ